MRQNPSRKKPVRGASPHSSRSPPRTLRAGAPTGSGPGRGVGLGGQHGLPGPVVELPGQRLDLRRRGLAAAPISGRRVLVGARGLQVAERVTVQPEQPLPRLVLVSSLSVYGHAALPDGATLDETAAPEPDPAMVLAEAQAVLAVDLSHRLLIIRTVLSTEMT